LFIENGKIERKPHKTNAGKKSGSQQQKESKQNKMNWV
jgi:hypothetical protein